MAANPAEIGYAPPEARTPVAIPEGTLKQGKPASFDTTRDNVGVPDFTALAERSRLTPEPTLPVVELHGFAAYQKAGGVFSEGLYETTMDGVIKLKEPGEREKSKFRTPTKLQIKGFEDRHNKPLPPPEQQITLTPEQIDAYCLLRESRLAIPWEDRQNGADPAKFNDGPLIQEILKMPSLESYLLSKQEQSQAPPVAA